MMHVLTCTNRRSINRTVSDANGKERPVQCSPDPVADFKPGVFDAPLRGCGA